MLVQRLGLAGTTAARPGRPIVPDQEATGLARAARPPRDAPVVQAWSIPPVTQEVSQPTGLTTNRLRSRLRVVRAISMLDAVDRDGQSWALTRHPAPSLTGLMPWSPTGTFTYYGDNRSPGRELHDTPNKQSAAEQGLRVGARGPEGKACL